MSDKAGVTSSAAYFIHKKPLYPNQHQELSLAYQLGKAIYC